MRCRVWFTGLCAAGWLGSIFVIPSVSCGVELSPSAPRTAVAAASDAPALVKTALEQGAAGRQTRRDELLLQALQADPNNAAAHWASGEVKLQGNWVSAESAANSAAQDPLLVQYRQRRDATAANAPDQLALGKWCQANGLKDEARSHFLNVLEIQPGQRDAIDLLGYKLRGGVWANASQLADENTASEKAQADLKTWQPVVAAIGRKFASAETKPAAIAELRAISDPAAAAALDAALVKANPELAKEIIDVLRRIPQQAASQSLVRHAVLNRSEPIRKAATAALKSRPTHSYVPLLLSGLTAPAESAVEVVHDATGVGVRHVVSQEGELHDRKRVKEAHLRLDVPNPQHSFFQQDALAQVMQAADASQKQLDKSNRKVEQMNQKIVHVLKSATGEDMGPQPRTWWDWWHDYTDTYSTGYRTASVDERRYEYNMPYYVPQTRYGYTLPESSPEPPVNPRPPHSCFGKGTPVWTLDGLVAIETVKAGDRVLSQDPDTGELAYRVVLQTTVRPDRPTLMVGLGDETISTTLGHLFWVTGDGWQMAKELEAGQRLQSPTHSTPVDSVRPGSNQAVYNLIVADFGTYFVGKSQVLVHDNTPRKPTLAVVPGLVRE